MVAAAAPGLATSSYCNNYVITRPEDKYTHDYYISAPIKSFWLAIQ